MKVRWYNWWVIFTMPLVICPFVICGLMFVEAYGDSMERIVGTLPVLLVSLLLAYTSLAFLLNSSVVEVEDDLVTVRHGPVPWKGCAFKLEDCREFFADRLHEARIVTDGVRIRFTDDTFKDLIGTDSREQAEQWAQSLNASLAEFREHKEVSQSQVP